MKTIWGGRLYKQAIQIKHLRKEAVGGWLEPEGETVTKKTERGAKAAQERRNVSGPTFLKRWPVLHRHATLREDSRLLKEPPRFILAERPAPSAPQTSFSDSREEKAKALLGAAAQSGLLHGASRLLSALLSLSVCADHPPPPIMLSLSPSVQLFPPFSHLGSDLNCICCPLRVHTNTEHTQTAES